MSEFLGVGKDKQSVKILKRFKDGLVTYDVDYLLDNLAREVYLLESYRRWRDSEERKLEEVKRND